MRRISRRSQSLRTARGVAALASVALLASGWNTGDAHADTDRDAIASQWDRFTAVAVAQGIGFQYTSSGDALASGARERWGGAISGSVPYSFAQTSDSRGAGIGSVFWPGFVTAQYKEALPILADTVPFVGISTPDNVRAIVKTVAEAAPAYPFIAATSGAKASEYTALPPTAVPGGSVSGVTMRCDPVAASVHCSSSVARADLGGAGTGSMTSVPAFGRALREARGRLASRLSGADFTTAIPMEDEAPAAVSAQGIDTAADAVLTEQEVRSLSTVNVADLNILGTVHLRNISAAASNITTGIEAELKRTVTLGEATVAGQAVTIDDQGIRLAENTVSKRADYDNANTQLQEALSAAGITIRLFGGAQTKGQAGGMTDEGEALYIGLKFPEPGVPESFFYMNFWVGGTLNSALGDPVMQPSSTDTASPAGDDQGDATASVSATPYGSSTRLVDAGASHPPRPATPRPSDERARAFFPSPTEISEIAETPALAGEADEATPALTAAPIAQPLSGAADRRREHQGVILAALGAWQLLGFGLVAAVGRNRMVARQRT